MVLSWRSGVNLEGTTKGTQRTKLIFVLLYDVHNVLT